MTADAVPSAPVPAAASGLAGPARVLILPGWQNSGPGHWQTLWEARHGCERLQQDDWWWPRRGDWMARLDETVRDHLAADPAADPVTGHPRPLLLAAHSLGCQLVAQWAAHSAHATGVAGALLVAPPDIERADMPPQLQAWGPIPRQPLPFASIAVVSQDDPYCDPARAARFVADWGCRAVDAGARGHLNADSGLGDWPEGWALLQALQP